MSDTNDIIDQIEVKVNELTSYIDANHRHINSSVALYEFTECIRQGFEDFKSTESDWRSDEEIEADAHGSRMCDRYHAKKDM